jgi:hypothetical protein
VSILIVAMTKHCGGGGAASSLGTANMTRKSCAVATSNPPSAETADEGPAEAAASDGEFEWDELTHGVILSSFWWGYVVTQLASGRATELFAWHLSRL